MVKIIISLLICLLFIFAGCKDKIISPNTDNLPPDSINYSWKIDTLNLDPFESLYDLWGNSAQDVWSVGSAGIWHYDGSKWKEFGDFSGIIFSSIYGFSSTDVWATTSDTGRIYHYDGSNWSLYQRFNFPGYSITSIKDIWGDSPNNVYAVGALYNTNGSAKGMILKYDGTKWDLL